MKIENKDLCSKCGGYCCKHLPGNYYPSDFNLPEIDPTKKDFQKLKKIINDPNIAVDWWEDTIIKYYLRPATKQAKRKFDPSWGGECVFLTITEKGCKLPYEERPLECQKLEPKETHPDCFMHGSLNKKTAYKAWLPYNDFIESFRYE